MAWICWCLFGTGMLWEAIKIGRVRGCPAPWHKQAPGNHSHLHKYSLNMRDKGKNTHTPRDNCIQPHPIIFLHYSLQTPQLILLFNSILIPLYRSRIGDWKLQGQKSVRDKQSALTDLNVKVQTLKRTELLWEGRWGYQEWPRRPHQGPYTFLAELNGIGKDATGKLLLLAF